MDIEEEVILVDGEVTEQLLAITKATIDKIKAYKSVESIRRSKGKKEKTEVDISGDMMLLYMFYAYTAKWQETHMIRCTTGYAASGLKWGEHRVIRAKKGLVDLGLVTDEKKTVESEVRNYIRFRYFIATKKQPCLNSQCANSQGEQATLSKLTPNKLTLSKLTDKLFRTNSLNSSELIANNPLPPPPLASLACVEPNQTVSQGEATEQELPYMPQINDGKSRPCEAATQQATEPAQVEQAHNLNTFALSNDNATNMVDAGGGLAAGPARSAVLRMVLSIFTKNELRPLTAGETRAWKKIHKDVTMEQVEKVKEFYALPKSNDCDSTWQRKKSLQTLMNDWYAQIDYAERSLAEAQKQDAHTKSFNDSYTVDAQMRELGILDGWQMDIQEALDSGKYSKPEQTQYLRRLLATPQDSLTPKQIGAIHKVLNGTR